MNSIKIAVIGGSGLYHVDGIEIVKRHEVFTPFGNPSAPIMEAKIQSGPELPELEEEKGHFYFLARHGEGHTILPSEVNYLANIFALKKLGVQYIISVSAVGSLQENLPPGTFVLPDQFIDWTKGLRKRSFFGEGMVGHVSTAYPIARPLQEVIGKTCQNLGVQHSLGGTYICIEGPQFSSRAESLFYRSMGASIIGMTNLPEAYLAKEAGMAYATVGMVTDFDCWKDEHCTLEEIMKIMAGNNQMAHRLIFALVPELLANPVSFVRENQHSVITAKEKLSGNHKQILKVILS